MLKKNHKLKRADFEMVFKKGKVLHSPNFSIRAIKVDSWNEFAFSVVVSKKVARLATARNRNKRKVYLALKKAFCEISNPSVGVIILKKDLSSIKVGEIATEIVRLLKQV